MKHSFITAVCLVLLAGQRNVDSCKTNNLIQKPQQQAEKAGESKEKLSVLLLASFFIGHQFPLIALGEELVRRGHHVTMMGPITEGSSVLPNLPESVGIKFIATGKVTQDPVRQMTKAAKNTTSFLHLIWNMNLTDDSQDYLKEMWAKVESMNGSQWNYVVTDNAVNLITYCTEKKWGPKVMMNFSPLPVLPCTRPPWPSPYAFSTSTDNLTFKERLTGILFHAPLEFLGFKVAVWIISGQIPNCTAPLHVFDNLGISSPVLFDTVLGFEYPKIIFPLQHYVGPILPKTAPPLGKDLLDWLAGRDKESVVYISMGSTGDLTPQQARGLLEGVMTTNYSVVWALRKNNRDCLEGMELNRDRVFVSEWVSQVAMLQHKTTTFAILHCGIGGVQEALINTIPVICLPYAWDQFSTAVRLTSQGLGVRILLDELSRERVEEAIRTIETGDIRKQVKKISKVLKMAGGAEKAADLVEFYAEVGYEHGVPAYIRYEWNWVVYYNVDVYVVLVVLLGLVSWVGIWLYRCCLRKCCCCCSSSKTKID